MQDAVKTISSSAAFENACIVHFESEFKFADKSVLNNSFIQAFKIEQAEAEAEAETRISPGSMI